MHLQLSPQYCNHSHHQPYMCPRFWYYKMNTHKNIFINSWINTQLFQNIYEVWKIKIWQNTCVAQPLWTLTSWNSSCLVHALLLSVELYLLFACLKLIVRWHAVLNFMRSIERVLLTTCYFVIAVVYLFCIFGSILSLGIIRAVVCPLHSVYFHCRAILYSVSIPARTCSLQPRKSYFQCFARTSFCGLMFFTSPEVPVLEIPQHLYLKEEVLRQRVCVFSMLLDND